MPCNLSSNDAIKFKTFPFPFFYCNFIIFFSFVIFFLRKGVP